jgi:cell division septal protein FtsQ
MARARKRTARSRYIIQILKGILILAVFAGLGWGIWHVTRLPSLTITEIEINGGDTIKHSVVRETVETELQGSYLAFIPRTFTYLFPAAAVRSAVAAIPRIKDVSVERDGKNKLTVMFNEYKPYALWCDENRAHCLLVDEEGYAFTDAPKLSGGSLLRFVVEDTPLLQRKHMLSRQQLVSTVEFSEQLKKEFGFSVEQVLYEQNKDVTYTLVGGGKLLTSSEEPIEVTLNNLDTILDSENFLHLRPNNFQYIDLRFGNKVFVNEEIEEKETATSTKEEVVEQ